MRVKRLLKSYSEIEQTMWKKLIDQFEVDSGYALFPTMWDKYGAHESEAFKNAQSGELGDIAARFQIRRAKMFDYNQPNYKIPFQVEIGAWMYKALYVNPMYINVKGVELDIPSIRVHRPSATLAILALMGYLPKDVGAYVNLYNEVSENKTMEEDKELQSQQPGEK